MEPAVLFWHVANFLLAPLLTGCLAAGLARLVWRRQLGGRTLRVAAACSVAMLLASLLGLVFFERDGQMATYAAMLVAGAAAIGWFGLRGRA